MIILHNYPTPYRVPFFEELNKFFNLEVWFLQEPNNDGRFWNNDLLKNVSFKYKFFNYKNFLIFNRSITYNKHLIAQLLKADFDICVNIDNFPTIYSLIVSFGICFLKSKKFVLWTAYYQNQHLISSNIKINKLYKMILGMYRIPLFKFSDLIFTYTKDAQKRIKIHFNNNVYHLPQVFPKSLIPFNLLSEKKSEKIKTILYVGYLNSWKNVSFLINTFRKISKNNWRLIIVGEGPERNYLEKLAKNDDRIKFKGYLTGYKKYRYFKNANLLTLVSNKDCWGLVINEAMHLGLPVIVSNNVEAKEIVKDNGYIIRQTSKYDLTNALHQILDHPNNEKRMGCASLRIIKEYSLKNMVKIFNQAIHLL